LCWWVRVRGRDRTPTVVTSDAYATMPVMKHLTYFKRFRMELELRHARPAPVLPQGFYWQPWEDALLNLHAEVKFLSFQNERDTVLFPALASAGGCRDLMAAIRPK